MSFRMSEDGPRIVDGRMLQWGADEVIVPERLVSRFQGCALGDTVMLNLTPFRVVGTFRSEGVYDGEIWGDVERVMDALERPYFQRIIARVDAATIDREAATADREEGESSIEALSARLRSDARAPLSIQYEREYLAMQTTAISGMLANLARFLTVIMGIAAVLGAMNTMIAAVSARVHEIGVLKSIGYRPQQIFGAFLLESGIIGLVGGVLGLFLVLPFHGVETGLTNWNTFTDVSFSFRLSPRIAVNAFVIASILGLVGGALPALRAARLQPVDALRIR
jgi:ABC-type antimicrobial peptide transport system permease subunit